VKTICIVSKDICLMIPTLGHVMGATRHNNPRSSWHVFPGWSLQQEGQIRRATSIKGQSKFTALSIQAKKNSSLSLISVSEIAGAPLARL
jgi:hypothetical protein